MRGWSETAGQVTLLVYDGKEGRFVAEARPHPFAPAKTQAGVRRQSGGEGK